MLAVREHTTRRMVARAHYHRFHQSLAMAVPAALVLLGIAIPEVQPEVRQVVAAQIPWEVRGE